MVKVLFSLTTFIIAGCVPLQQQILDSQNQLLQGYELCNLVTSNSEFQQTINPTIHEIDLINRGYSGENFHILMYENFQSDFSIAGYGNIIAGVLKNKAPNPTSDPVRIIQDYILTTINYGGAGDGGPLIEFRPIWDGKYYLTDDIPTVDIVFSFKDLDTRKALIYKRLRFDLSTIRLSTTNLIYINLLGYQKLLEYKY